MRKIVVGNIMGSSIPEGSIVTLFETPKEVAVLSEISPSEYRVIKALFERESSRLAGFVKRLTPCKEDGEFIQVYGCGHTIDTFTYLTS